ncbi:MAG: hypothetical protein P8168_08335 [Deltaproteobacteria bacterium]
MRRKTWIIVLAIAILAAGLGGGFYWHWYNSPRYALQQAVLALETRNMDKFFNYVDLKEIVINFSNASSKDLESQSEHQVDNWTRYSRRLAGKFTQLFLPKLIESFQPQVRKVLEHHLLNLNHTQILGIAAAVTVAQIDTQGSEAKVTLTDPQSQETLRFKMRRQPESGVWQIVSVNYADLKRFYKRELCR